MKNIIYICISFLFLTACSKKEMEPREDPDARLTGILTDYKETLTDAEHGWIGTIFPGAGGGYSFFINFSKNDRLQMLGDFNKETATILSESSYRLKALQRPTLIFDTYNYLHLIHDPDTEISGGDRGQGLMSDFEFAFVEVEKDKILLNGTFNKNKMILRAASSAEKEAIENGAWADALTSTEELASRNPYLYIDIDGSQKLSLELNIINKKATISWLVDEDSHTLTENFTFYEKGILLENPFQYESLSISHFEFNKENGELNAIGNNEIMPVVSSSNPILPLYTFFGYNEDWTTLYIDGEKMPKGVSSTFNTIYEDMANLFQASGRQILYTDLTFSDADQIDLRVRYKSISSGSEFSATATYEFKEDKDVITLKEVATNNNWNTRSTQVKPLYDYFKHSEFKIDWVTSTSSELGLLGGLKPINDPSSFFYGALK